MRIELTTSSLPRKCSTPELQRLLASATSGIKPKGSDSISSSDSWSGRPGSNRPPEAWKATALPNELLPLLIPFGTVVISIYLNTPLNIRKCCVVWCGQGWIRTTELRRGQIYSLLPLATWLLARLEPPARIELATY